MPGRNKPLITRNGIPDPQAYNPQTGQWESFIGVSWGKTAGGLYVPIRVDDQGRQEVTLSGAIDEVVCETTSDALMTSDITNVGENAGIIGSARTVDIRGYRQLAVQVINRHDVAINVTYIRLAKVWGMPLDHPNYERQLSRTQDLALTIPAGASVLLQSKEYAILSEIGLGLLLTLSRSAAPTVGNITVTVLGRR